MALRGRYHSCLLLVLHFRLKPLLFRSGAGFRQSRVGIAIEFSQSQGRLLLSEVRFRDGQIRLRLTYPAVGIRARLGGLKTILLQLFLQYGNLIAGHLRFCLCVGKSRTGLIFPSAHLRVVQTRDDLARGYGVPSRTVTSRIFPLVFGATAESSPSTRPLNATMLSGSLGVAKNVSHTTAATTTMPKKMRIGTMRDRGALASSARGATRAGGGGLRCSELCGACVIVLVFISLMIFSLPHFP